MEFFGFSKRYKTVIVDQKNVCGDYGGKGIDRGSLDGEDEEDVSSLC